jgi:chorismate mutase/prephenate dehydrogenase
VADDLKHLRERIRALDDQLLGLVKERLELARAIGAVKLASGLPIKDYKVEKDVLARAAQRARELDLYEELATDLSKLLIRYSVQAQDEYHHRQSARGATRPSRILIAGGLGRMGGWLAEFFDSFGHEVSLYEPDAVAPGAAPPSHPLTIALEPALEQADVVVLAAPISETAPLIDRLTIAKPRGLIFDICSLKSPLVAAIERARKAGLRIASVHPMFGPKVEVLADRNIVVCDCGDGAAAAEARALFESTSARLVTMPLSEHDKLMSCVLGLSHMASLIFGRALATSGLAYERLAEVASTTFRAQLGVTIPVVNENPDLYYEIQVENDHTAAILDSLSQAFAVYRGVIEGEDRAAFKAMMEESRAFLGAPCEE